jgi:PIN domain nuclease of toxin-antitoxin system
MGWASTRSPRCSEPRREPLLDIQLLLWAAGQPQRLSARGKRQINDPRNQRLSSAASLWEIAIKAGLDRGDFLDR